VDSLHEESVEALKEIAEIPAAAVSGGREQALVDSAPSEDLRKELSEVLGLREQERTGTRFSPGRALAVLNAGSEMGSEMGSATSSDAAGRFAVSET
jgi:hypothetical protein